jgi:hypothetical protein
MARAKKLLWLAALALVPMSFLLMELAFRYPAHTERLYGEWLYPRVTLALGALNGLFPFSLAQGAGLALLILGLGYLLFGKRRSGSRLATLVGAIAVLWALAGIIGLWFLISWGLNYARPGLEKRLELSTGEIDLQEVLDAGKWCAKRATELHAFLEQPVDEPTRLPMGFARLNEILDRRLIELRLPGDRIEPPTSPAKKLWGSTVLAYLGLSGIFIPFTGEPSINAIVPDASLPIVVAHERAHQRGITNEGEANLVAFMTCSGIAEQPYLPYAAYLYAAAQLLQAASLQSPEEASSVWVELGPGPRRDLEAIREFWARYHGPAAEAADRVNDLYLRSFRVPEGVHSYQRVVRLLVALDRQGKL